ncbi:hypothetical protein BDV19DRAFT_398433 [Aspergillus venezuelensis]
MDPETFSYIYHHVIFPPKLPAEPERKQKPLEKELMSFVQAAITSFLKERPADIQEKWKPVVQMINTWFTIDTANVDLNRHQELLTRSLKNLKDIVSSLSTAILTAPGSLICSFPGQSIALPAAMVEDIEFCKYLSHNLCRLNLEVVRQMCPKAAEFRNCTEEIRNTVHPGLITEGLMSRLLEFGEHNVFRSFEKHVQDDVNFDDGKVPWRRSPLWFLMKVALQTILYRAFTYPQSRAEYKNFMLYLAVEIGSAAQRLDACDIADVLAVVRSKITCRVYKLQDATFDFVLQRVTEVDDSIMQRLQDLHRQIHVSTTKTVTPSLGPVRETDLATSLRTFEEYLREAMMQTVAMRPPNTFDRTHKKRNQRMATGLPKLEDDCDFLGLLDFEGWMPDGMSRMFLVVMELWVCYDSICITLCPLFGSFSPEFPKKFLQPLLLPQHCQMRRAQVVEDYIRQRHQNTQKGRSIFNDPGPDTFAAQYFDRSVRQRKLRDEIIRSATQARDSRCKSWEYLSAKYQDLVSQSSKLAHDSDYNEWNEEIHFTSCEKCKLENRARNLQIEVHEWPLPTDDDLVKNVVFELKWSADWRDITWRLIEDYGRPQKRDKSHHEMKLLEYPPLQQFAFKEPHRMLLASKEKSWLNTHYKPQRFPVTFDKIGVPNTFDFALWHNEREVWALVRCRLAKPTVKRLCNIVISAPRYATLQYAVESSSHQQNKVLADQRDGHPRLSLHELCAFGSLRSGERLPWYIITRELSLLILSMNEESVHGLFCQAAWELGSPIPGTQLRETHVFFREPESVNRLLQSLQEKLESISTNWNEHYTLYTLVVLGVRMLSLCSIPAVERTASFLRRCRDIAMGWCNTLLAEDDQQHELLFRLGGICLSTYSVETQHLPIILRTHLDLEILVRASIVLFQNSPQPMEEQTLEIRTLNLRATLVLRRAETRVSELIESDTPAISNAVRHGANNLQFVSPWHFDIGDNMRWVKNLSVATETTEQQEYRYNILTGELLVDNTPPSRLPGDYTDKPLFKRLFGKRTMLFASAQLFGNYQVHFEFDDAQLLIRAEEKILRLIPHETLAEDFPDSLITDHVHWLDPVTGILEFRPLDQAWQPNPQNWHLPLQQDMGQASTTRQGQRRLVDVHSSLFAQVADVLQSLDEPKHIRVTLTQGGTVEAKLVRLRLNFILNDQGLLELLRSRSEQCGRTVLIPYGRVRVRKGTLSPEVFVEMANAPHIRYFHYQPDSDLGILTGATGMEAVLYQAYLHAATTFVLPDPATNRTGTEEALRILRQAKLRTSLPLTTDSVQLLEQIAALTPRRRFWLPGMKVMQRMLWNQSLGELAQHDDFVRLAQSIFDHAARFTQFWGPKKEVVPPGLNRKDQKLVDRARNRIALLRRPDIEELPQKAPTEYDSRDRTLPASDRSVRVYEITSLIREWPSTLSAKESLINMIKSWGPLDLQIRPPSQYTYTSLIESPIHKLWGSLYSKCRMSRKETDTYSLVSVFGTVVFGGMPLDYLRHLLAVAFIGSSPEIPKEILRHQVQLDLAPGQPIDKIRIESIILRHYSPHKSDFGPHPKSKSKSEKKRIGKDQKKKYDVKKKRAVDSLCGAKVFNECDALFKKCTKNVKLYGLLQTVQAKLDTLAISTRPDVLFPALPGRLQIDPHSAAFWSPPNLSGLLNSTNAPCPMDMDEDLDEDLFKMKRNLALACSSNLESLLSRQSLGSGGLVSEYAKDLQKSLGALEEVNLPSVPDEIAVDKEAKILSALTSVEQNWKFIGISTLWPSITVLSVISFLAADKWHAVPEEWKVALIQFAKVISSLRRCKRLLKYLEQGDVTSFYKEAESIGCEGWQASESPDWLLFEIESNLTIRERQAEVAWRMITPGDQENSVLQLNMGEGKTTVITPMIAARLANGNHLLRIIVLKPLLKQSVYLLSQRLGGLLNRPIYYIPLSRTTRFDNDLINKLEEIYQKCQNERGVLMVLPEQLLSFKLVGLDLTSDAADRLVQLEQSIQDSCRTIIDESDEVLDPKFQLIYTQGNQQNVDGESDRWDVIQDVFNLIEKQAFTLQQEVPGSLNIEKLGVRYPLLHFLIKDTPRLLLERVIGAINNGALPGLHFPQWPRHAREGALNFISSLRIEKTQEDTVRRHFKNTIMLKKLLVLRGLFGHSSLHFALAGKRWLVDYGVDSDRCLMAVPFRAKGVPSANSEFGHTDVALTLTCLSYYYKGLTEDQVRQCLQSLMKEDDPGTEYQRWILRQQDNLPAGLRSVNGVNLEDAQNFHQVLYPHLHYQKPIIDFFLSRKDLPDLLHTNAMVLEELLREENRHCVLAQNRDGHQLPVTELLRLIKDQDPSVQVIIDVGAQILESSNEDVAKTWLAMVPSNKAAAVIYFDLNDEAMVLDIDGYSEPLLASPFRGRENLCLVFLDQHHSRGVDLKLPRNYRAAVTLGPRLTKDRLVQACHRMRELGNGQAVTFFVPPEVKHSINSEGNAAITSFEVIQWLQPLWAWQGRLTLYDAKAGELVEIWENASSVATQLHEEQEREIVKEVQREQHVCRPPLVKSLEHHVDSALKHFVIHGHFPRWFASDALRPAFKCLSTTTAAQFNPPLNIHPKLWATVDFLNTIEQENDDQANDEFLKSVHWVLSNTQDEMLLVISQYEANALLPSIRTSDKVILHMYAPRTTKDMKSFSKLDFLTIGNIRPHSRSSRGVFTFYFDSFNEYIDACNFFGFATDHSLDFPADAITSEGFVNEQARNQVGWPVKCPFTTSPLLFLKSWYSIRTKGHGFSQSHIGSIIEARGLNAETFS